MAFMTTVHLFRCLALRAASLLFQTNESVLMKAAFTGFDYCTAAISLVSIKRQIVNFISVCSLVDDEDCVGRASASVTGEQRCSAKRGKVDAAAAAAAAGPVLDEQGGRESKTEGDGEMAFGDFV
jgi:hypothetical protein